MFFCSSPDCWEPWMSHLGNAYPVGFSTEYSHELPENSQLFLAGQFEFVVALHMNPWNNCQCTLCPWFEGLALLCWQPVNYGTVCAWLAPGTIKCLSADWHMEGSRFRITCQNGISSPHTRMAWISRARGRGGRIQQRHWLVWHV